MIRCWQDGSSGSAGRTLVDGTASRADPPVTFAFRIRSRAGRMKTERLRMLRNMPIFGGLRDDILEFVVAEAAETTLADGDFLFQENDPADSMYVLEDGQVAVLKRWEKIYYRINDLNPGDCIGEMSLIDLGRRSATVLATSDCRLIELTHASVRRLYEKDPEQFTLIQMNIARELSRRLRVADEALFRELVNANKIPQH